MMHLIRFRIRGVLKARTRSPQPPEIMESENINVDQKSTKQRAPCQVTPVCLVHAACPRCNTDRVCRRIATTLGGFRVIECEAMFNYGFATFTLPGDAHPIRRASLRSQFAYTTQSASIRVGGKRSSYAIRGLLERLSPFGVVGAVCGLEFTNGGGIGDNWNFHLHCILIGDGPITIPESNKTIQGLFENSIGEYLEHGEQNPWSKKFARETGFGPQYQYTTLGSYEDSISELSKLTYGIKVARAGGKDKMLKCLYDEMNEFYNYGQKRVNMMRKLGVARTNWDQKLLFAQLYPEDAHAQIILRDIDRKMMIDYERRGMGAGDIGCSGLGHNAEDGRFERVDVYGDKVRKWYDV